MNEWVFAAIVFLTVSIIGAWALCVKYYVRLGRISYLTRKGWIIRHKYFSGEMETGHYAWQAKAKDEKEWRHMDEAVKRQRKLDDILTYNLPEEKEWLEQVDWR